MFRSFDPDGPHYLTGEVTKVRQNGATSGIGVLATYGYDDLGNRTSATYGNGASQAFGYDGVSRLSSLTVNLSGTANDLTKTFAYNPASQIVSETRSNDAYSQVLANSTQTTVTNGLNQLSTVNGTAAAYDGRGNMTTDPVTGKTYSYLPSNNQLYNIPSPFATFTYDGLDRLANVNNGGTLTNYVTDGMDVVAEYNSSNVLQKRYAFDGSGQPLVVYDAAGNRSWMLADERGSIIALANDSAAMTAIDTYDEYGIPGASNQGTFQYAGMMWLVRPGVYAPMYRAYNQLHGRFHQTDPIGLLSGVNLYGYVLNNPVNLVDPLGLQAGSPPCNGSSAPNCNIIVVYCQNGGTPIQVGTGIYDCVVPEQDFGIGGSGGGGRSGGGGGGGGGSGDQDRQRKISPCIQKFLASQGYGAPNLPSLTFNRGSGSNLTAKAAFALGYPAITLGNTVYVSPTAWSSGQFTPGTSGFFEETIHSIQWSQSGGASFLGAYLSGGGAALLLTGNAHDNPVELEAIAISKRLEREFANSNRCP